MRKYLAVLAALSVAACASGTPMQESKEAAAPIPKDMGRIVVYRTGIMGTAIQPGIAVDGSYKGKCIPKGAFSVDVKPGNHLISTETESRVETLVTVGKQQTAYVRCSIGMGVVVGRPVLEVVPPATGQSESASLAFTGKY